MKAIAGEFTGDMLSRLYFVWANLYGIGEQAWDDARMVVQIGAASEDAMDVARRRGLFEVNGATCRLALLRDRAGRRHLGDEEDAPLIDQLHHAMRLWKDEDRAGLVEYLRDHELADHAPFWKLAQALFEVLPHNEEDWKLVSALLGERETLRVETRKNGRTSPPQERGLFDRGNQRYAQAGSLGYDVGEAGSFAWSCLLLFLLSCFRTFVIRFRTERTSTMIEQLKPWYAVAIPHEDIRESRLDEAIFAANLWGVSPNRAPEVYLDPGSLLRQDLLDRRTEQGHAEGVACLIRRCRRRRPHHQPANRVRRR